MPVSGRGEPEHALERKVVGRRVEQIPPADHMCDALVRVVDYDREVVGDQPVAAGDYKGLARRGRTPDKFGGWTAEVRQADWGHRAEKRTWLYIVGTGPDDLPEIPAPRQHTAVVVRMPECKTVEIMSKSEREHTPLAFAEWLVAVARKVHNT